MACRFPAAQLVLPSRHPLKLGALILVAFVGCSSSEDEPTPSSPSKLTQALSKSPASDAAETAVPIGAGENAQQGAGQRPSSQRRTSPRGPRTLADLVDSAVSGRDESTWVELFNGSDLAGWQVVGNGGWSVEDGAVVGTPNGSTGRLTTDAEFSDFELELEYYLEREGASGVFFRVPHKEEDTGDLLQIQLLDESTSKYRSLPKNVRNGSLWRQIAPNPIMRLSPERWCPLRFSVVGDHLQVWIGDTKVVDGILPAHSSSNGSIGLELHTGTVRFRSVRIRRLDRDVDASQLAVSTRPTQPGNGTAHASSTPGGDDSFFADAGSTNSKSDSNPFFADTQMDVPDLEDDPFFEMPDHGPFNTGDDAFFAASSDDAEQVDARLALPSGAEAVVSRSADPADMPFQLPYYPPHYSIVGKPFRSPPIKMPEGSPKVTWELIGGHSDMTIDPQTGGVTWRTADVKAETITLLARSENGAQYMNWPHKAIKTEFDNIDMYRSRYFVYITLPKYARLLREGEVATYLDAGWQYYTNVMGAEPSPLQALRYDPTQSGANSGNPISVGTAFWRDNFSINRPLQRAPFHRYHMAVWDHEAGHNFLSLTRAIWFEAGWFASWWHHGCPCLEALVPYQATRSPRKFGLRNAGLLEFQKGVRDAIAHQAKQLVKLNDHISRGGSIRTPPKHLGGAWQGIVSRTIQEHGPEPFEAVFRALRHDGLPPHVLKQIETPRNPVAGLSRADYRVIFLVALLSKGAKHDLSADFRQIGFPIDPAAFQQCQKLVEENWHHIPPNDVYGWSQCPVNGKWYRLTRWNMTWQQAEQHARLAGGHLATITSKEQEDWLKHRYQKPGLFWIGLRDKTGHGDWQWTSGERLTYKGWRPGNPESPAHQVVLLGPMGWNDTSHHQHDSWLRRGLVEVDKPADAWKY